MGYNPYVGKNPNNFIKDYFDAKATAEKRLRDTEQYNLDKTNRENLINAIKGGNQEEIDSALASYSPADYINRQQKLADLQDQKDWQLKMAQMNNAAALERAQLARSGGANGGFGNTEAGLALRIISSPNDYEPEMVSWAENKLAGNSSESAYDMAYHKKRGAKQAEQEFERTANAYAANQRLNNLQDVLSIVQGMDRKMFTPVGAVQAKLGKYGDVAGLSSLGGMSENERTQRAMIDRAITDIGQDLIARAKSKGQAGINTLGEIERILGNLSMTSGRAELIGALQELAKQEQKLNALETIATPMPSTSTSSNQQSREYYANKYGF